jgi:hypothetical protein
MVGAILAVVFLPLNAVANPHPNILVNYLEFDFGEVEIGSSNTVTISVNNDGGHDLWVDGVAFTGESSADFYFATEPAVPAHVPPNDGGPGYPLLVDVVFAPSAPGFAQAFLEIISNDPDDSPTTVVLYGEVVEPQGPLTIEDILAFFDAGVEAGTIEGQGRCSRAKRVHLRIFKFKLILAAIFLDRGWNQGTCKLLQLAYAFSDGQGGPRDKIVGDAVPELNTMILELMTSLGCQ